MKNLRQNQRPARNKAALKSVFFLMLAGTAPAQTAFAKAVGTVKSVNVNSVVLATDSGHVTVTLAKTAAPSGAAAATIVSPWNLGGSPGGEGRASKTA